MTSGTPESFNRRGFLRRIALGLAGTRTLRLRGATTRQAEAPSLSPQEREKITALIAAHRPSRLATLPRDFNRRVGASHVAGKYHLTTKPFLLEGADKLLELGTRLGKFWFTTDRIAGSYLFNSQWGQYPNFVALARSEYFSQLLAMPFQTLIFEAHTPVEEGWKRPNRPAEFYAKVTDEFYQLTSHLYRTCPDRDLTIILQHWEGDWMLRGSGEKWNPPPDDWRMRCEQMQRWLAARQAGVTKAREEFGRGAKCRVAHAAEVNRVADAWKGIPTMTEHVLPGIELDLVSYSCYDGLSSPLQLWNCIAEIRRHARTGPLFGKGAVYVGEIGIPENDQPQRLTERWDEFMGVLLAARVEYVVHWELYCNEFRSGLKEKPTASVEDPAMMRGFWLVKPDGSLSEGGKYFHKLWQRAAKG